MGDLCPASHNMDIPFTKRVEYTYLTCDENTGEVSLLTEDGNTKDDLNLPTFVKIGEPTDDDKKLVKDLLKSQEAGDEMTVIVLCACGNEKIVALKTTEVK